MSKVLVTGANGFIGRNCLLPLEERGYEVHAVSTCVVMQSNPKVHWHHVDLLNEHDVTDLMRNVSPSHLLHLAWVTTTGEFWATEKNLDWVQSSLHLIREFLAQDGHRLVVAGTCAEYEWKDRHYHEYETNTIPATLYGASKHALHLITEAYANGAGVSSAWGRVFWAYGPHECKDRLVAYVIRSLLNGEVAKCSHGRQVRDFLHVRDVADSFVALLDSDVKGPVNIASGRPVVIKELLMLIGDMLGCPELIGLDLIEATPGDPSHIIASVVRLNNEVGWRPRIDLQEGLESTIKWWRAQPARCD